MENNRELFQKYQEQKEQDRMTEYVHPMRVLETYRRSVDYYNSYGLCLKPKSQDAHLAVRSERILVDKN